MNVLVACEESQEVCKAFRARGHRAFSCDIQECSAGHPEWHILGDCIPILNGNVDFTTQDGKLHHISGHWDLIIAHPPCTDLAVSGARHFAKKREDGRQQKSIDFFMVFTNVNCDRVAIENPISIMSTVWRKPDQIIQPFQYGHPVRKSTCLWLKGLDKLSPTNIVDFEKIHSAGRSGGYSGNSWYCKDENGKIIPWNDPRTARIRSKTFSGIADAMAEQWGNIV